MDNTLNYQQARRIRERSIKDVIADELIRGKGVGSALTGAIGLKTQARMKGIKEKFDPLNIVKFLTFGSRLGPALYGKLFGRSRKDIEYFTGRASAIGEKHKKITGLPGEGEDITGMQLALEKILKFLKKSHDRDMILREKENNLRESGKLEDERRHKELLKALGVQDIPVKEVETKEKGGFLDGIMNIFKDIWEKIKGLADIIGVIKNTVLEIAKKIGFKAVEALSSAGRWALGTITAPGVVAGGVTLAASVAVAAAAKYLQDKQIEKAADRGDKKEVSKLLLEQAYPAETLFSLPPEDQVKAMQEVDKLADDVIEAAKQRNMEKAENQREIGSLSRRYPVNTTPTATSTPAPNVNAAGNVTNVSGGENNTNLTVPVANEPKSSTLNNVIKQNLDLNLTPKTIKNNQQTGVTNVINSSQAAQHKKIPIPPVRNLEESFQRMIMSSTRVV